MHNHALRGCGIAYNVISPAAHSPQNSIDRIISALQTLGRGSHISARLSAEALRSLANYYESEVKRPFPPLDHPDFGEAGVHAYADAIDAWLAFSKAANATGAA